MSPRSLFSLIAAAVVLIIAANSLYIINETQRGVLLRFGELVETDIEPGLHLKLPLVDQVTKFDVRVLTLDSRPQRYLTQEKKAVIVDSYATWQIIDVAKFYRATAGDEFTAKKLLAARIDNGLRDQFGKRTIREVVSGERDELMAELTRAMDEITEDEFGIKLIDIRVKGIDLPPEVSNSVFNRMRTERERIAGELRSQGKELAEGIKADADRQSIIIEAEAFREAERIRGEGDAIAAKIYADAYGQNPEFYSFYRSLRAYEETFNNPGDLLILDPNSEFFKYLKQSEGG